MRLIPASTLPVDPTGLSYEAGSQTVDPRDQLTPGMCRITNGEDILENITGLSGDQQRQLYNNMLLDPRWYKWMLQSGVKRFGKPRYWQIGQLHQDKWPGAITNLPAVDATGAIVGTHPEIGSYKTGVGLSFDDMGNGSSRLGIFQTGHKGVLGWLPTDGLQLVNNHAVGLEKLPLLASVPEIELFKILMPPMHKTNYYYRMFITETVYFREPVVMNVNGYRPIDVFHQSNLGLPLMPTYSSPVGATDAIMDVNTGGNNGSD